MASIHFATAALVGLVASGGGACASRDVPQRYPKTSAASVEAPAAPAAVVTRSLESDPPLPGAPAKGWPGLGQPEAPAHDHAHHQHGAQPPQPAPEPQKDHGAHHDH